MGFPYVRMIYIPGTYSSAGVFVRKKKHFYLVFLFFFSAGSPKKYARGNSVLLLLAPAVFLLVVFFTFLSLPSKEYAPGPHDDCIISRGSVAAYSTRYLS